MNFCEFSSCYSITVLLFTLKHLTLGHIRQHNKLAAVLGLGRSTQCKWPRWDDSSCSQNSGYLGLLAAVT